MPGQVGGGPERRSGEWRILLLPAAFPEGLAGMLNLRRAAVKTVADP
jgi:hypothetical protein